MPASAVIPALRVYDNVAAVKTFVVYVGEVLRLSQKSDTLGIVGSNQLIWRQLRLWFSSGNLLRSFLATLGEAPTYFGT